MLVFRADDLSIHALKLGPIGTNCYFVASPSLSFIVDPVDDADGLIAYARQHGLTPRFALLTHAHFDHAGAAAGLLEQGAIDDLWLHEADRAELARCRTYSMLIAKRPFISPPADKIRHFDPDFDARLAKAGWAVRHLPSHTPGSCVLYSLDRRLLFTGDILLNNLVPGVRTAVGEHRRGMRGAITAIAADFPPRTLVFPGHGKLSLLETELMYNAIVQRLLAEETP